MKKQILVVEYDLPTIENIKEFLMSPVFDITVAEEGETAKNILSSKSFDLMISAAMLPKFHGFNLSQYVASSFPETKIIIISGVYRGLDYKHQATTQYKADDFFEKPLDGTKLKERIMELLDLEEQDLQIEAGKSTTQIPAVDTAKIPTIKKLQETEKNLTSEDLFGDIIQTVEKTPAQPPAATDKKQPATSSSLTDDLDLLVKKDKPLEKDKSYSNLDDEISKKLEETLSGLGLSSKKTEEKQPDKPAPPVEEKPEPAAVKTVEKKAREVDSDGEEIGGYDILGLIARGGMAEIYKAKKKGVKGFEKIIAIKKILSGYGEDDRYIEMFVDEAKIAAELTHPNIVQIHDLGKKDDYYFIAMEYVQGKDLREIARKLQESGLSFPEELAIHLIIKILTALNFAHTAKDKDGKNLDIVHRDISPPNILVSYAGEVKLTDFGVSKASNKIHQTIAGALKGKLLYMSPEQARGEGDIDFRSDIYSAGVILFELITGEKLFLDSSEMVVLKKVQEGNVTKPTKINKDIDNELEDIVLKALTSDKNQRYQNTQAFIKDLESYIHKNYNRAPDQNHIAHFLCGLFKTEIKKENLKIDLKPVTQEVKKIVKKKTTIPEKKKEKVPVEEPQEIPEASVEPESTPKKVEIEAEREGKIREEIGPVAIEIDLDEVETKLPEKEIAPTPAKSPPSPKPPPIRSEKLTFEKETKKKRIGLIAAIIIVVAIAAGIYFIFLNKSSTGTTGPTKIGQNATPIQSTVSDKKPAAITTDQDNQKTPETTANKTLTGDAAAQPDANKDQIAESKPEIKSKPEAKKPVEKPQIKQEKTIKKSEPKTQPARSKPKPVQPKTQKKTIQKTPIQKEKPETTKTEPKKEDPAKTEATPDQTTDAKKEEQPAATIPDPKLQKTEAKQPVQMTPPPVVVKEGQTFALNQVDTQPIQISAPSPKISPRELRSSGNTIILAMILINHNGDVERVRLIRKSSIKRTNNTIITTFKKWKYKPATKNNVKVKVWKSIQFTLKPNK